MNQRKVVVVYHNRSLPIELLNKIISELTFTLESPVIHIHSKLNVQVYPKKFFVSTFVLNFNVSTPKSLYVLFEDDITNFAYDRINEVLCDCSAFAGPVTIMNTDNRQFTNMEYVANIEKIVDAITERTRSDFAIVPKTVCK